ncbi:LysM peptidoglycan-binding domain-containing protein [Phytohabitans kaempferiae]|uniref:LysM peptidoglycan-binding domain-containing protein n=1 Tax=Phytohabitans kaempferiae TaxID=1620943 RepID=A0ABV6LUW5_9ACTN
MRLRQVVKGLGALAILIGLLVGAPIALAVFAGNPLPDHVPTLAEVGDALTTRDDGQLFLRALAVVGWLGWATFALSVLVEIPARALRIPVPRLPGLRRQQRMAAALIGGVALIIGASPAVASAAASTPHTSYAAAPYTPAAVSAPAAAAWERAAAATSDEEQAPVYRVERGDYLGHIADRYLGEFDRYPELAKLNKIRDPDVIRPGQMLHLPEEAADSGIRRHATGLVSVPPSAENPPPPVESGPPPADAGQPPSGGGEQPGDTPRSPSPRPGDRTEAKGKPSPVPSNPVTEEPAVPYVPPPPTVQDGEDAERQPVGAGAAAARPGGKEGLNLPLAVTAVLTAASLVGAQIGVLLGLRDKRREARQRSRRS